MSVAILSLFTQAYAFEDDVVDGTSYNQVGQVISLHDRVVNPNNYTASASIEFVFTNVEGDNYWESKKKTVEAGPNQTFVTHNDYFIQNVGKFYIHMVYDIDGVITKNPNPTEFIIFEEYSKAALNGCKPQHELIVKPDYSLAVCVFEDSVKELSQRGWVTD